MTKQTIIAENMERLKHVKYVSEQKEGTGTARSKLWYWKGRTRCLQKKILTEGKPIDNFVIVKEQHTNVNVQSCDWLFIFSAKKDQLKQEIEWTWHNCSI